MREWGRDGLTGNLRLVDANYYIRMDKQWILHSTGNHSQSAEINHNGIEYFLKNVYICKLSYFAVQQRQQRLTQYCKSTILQLKEIQKK